MEHLTIDIGASSGKILWGRLREGKLETRVVWRFQNGCHEHEGHLVWDLEHLFQEILSGLKETRRLGLKPETIALDTWGCDYVLLDEKGAMTGDAVAYRDERTEHVSSPIPWSEMYRRCGIQKLSFNTVYQLLALKAEHPEELEQAAHLLMIPDYLAYRLTGVMHQEYTNATTTSLVDARSRDWDKGLISRLGLPGRLFTPLVQPGTVYGKLTGAVTEATGLDATVIAAPTHDTASAVVGSPLGPRSAFLSSGTWSLLGALVPQPVIRDDTMKENFTNEGGVNGTIRLLRNLMGTWMLQNLRREWGEEHTFPELAEEAKKHASFPTVVDIEDERFLAPKNMQEEIASACRDTKQPLPQSMGDCLACVYHSLAEGYKKALHRLEKLTGTTYDHLAIVGGGSKDSYLCQLTADSLGILVTAGPDEGTAYGNLLSQMVSCGELNDMEEARAVLQRSITLRSYQRREPK